MSPGTADPDWSGKGAAWAPYADYVSSSQPSVPRQRPLAEVHGRLLVDTTPTFRAEARRGGMAARVAPTWPRWSETWLAGSRHQRSKTQNPPIGLGLKGFPRATHHFRQKLWIHS